ncbi:hypothetical protein QG37_06440 [Candidozyma auris]|uniref:Uncharacterized protein n=1 Tax=Candidozyma auris TaxID=498019 RepID=A0A0L0NT93_CANAR|nr:hypothetical protein QG37_06440 [[Candida] auris]
MKHMGEEVLLDANNGDFEGHLEKNFNEYQP